MNARAAPRARGQGAEAKGHRHSNQLSREQLHRENERLLRENEELRRKVAEREQQIAEREKQIADAEKQIAHLERQLAGRKKNSTNSSKPPSSDASAGEQRPRGRRKADRGFGAATGGAEKELDQFLQTTFFRRIGWRAETSRPKEQEQEQAEAGWPTRTPGASPTIGSLRRGERHGGPAAEAMRALRRKSAARAQPGDYARRAAAASGDRGAPGEGPRHRVSVSERGLWRLRKGLARAAARGDQRGFWTAIDGADRLLDGRLSAAAAAGGSHAGRRAGHPDQFGEYPESLGRSQPGGRTTGATIAGAVAARSGPECG